MNTTQQLTHTPPQTATPRPITPGRGSASPDPPTLGELFHTAGPLISTPAFYGPPVISLLGPWLLLVLLLIPPFAVIVTGVLLLAVAAGVLVVFAAAIASPYLLMRHLHGHHVVAAMPRVTLHLLRKHRVSSGPLGSLQPKGVS